MIDAKNDLRIVFMGTPEFAIPSLEILLHNKFNLVGVVTAPDKPAGRGKKMKSPAIKEFADQHNLPVLQPERLKNPEFINQLKALQGNLFVVVAFRMLPEVVWKLPEFGTFNLHASLLPQYRGAAPINHVIINGEKKTGVTTFFIEKNIDTGDIIDQKEITIQPNETAGTLHDKLMALGADLVFETTESIKNGTCKSVKQDNMINNKTNLKTAPKIRRETCKINWQNSAEEIERFVRSLSPYPTAWTTQKIMDGEIQFKIFGASAEKALHEKTPGAIETDGEKLLRVAAGDGFIHVHEIQQAGRKKMPVEAFLKGFMVTDNTKFE